MQSNSLRNILKVTNKTIAYKIYLYPRKEHRKPYKSFHDNFDLKKLRKL